jgi:diguanylate cyclase (GGDEF)-like protein
MAAEELAAEGIDDLTGTLLRRVGLRAMQREIDRTRRSGEGLAVAYVDVDGLKHVNDTGGHLAGDDLLTDVARSIMHHLRSYDVICRFGGDEFVCSLAGLDAAGAGGRFDEIRRSLSDASTGATISVGFAERGVEDTLEGLIARADAALISTRHRSEA